MTPEATNPPSAPDPEPSAPAVTPPAPPALNPARAFNALGNEFRWKMYQHIAANGPAGASDLARLFKHTLTATVQHLHRMADAGVVTQLRAEDRRYTFYAIPKWARVSPGLADYGAFVVRLPQRVEINPNTAIPTQPQPNTSP